MKTLSNGLDVCGNYVASPGDYVVSPGDFFSSLTSPYIFNEPVLGGFNQFEDMLNPTSIDCFTNSIYSSYFVENSDHTKEKVGKSHANASSSKQRIFIPKNIDSLPKNPDIFYKNQSMFNKDMKPYRIRSNI